MTGARWRKPHFLRACKALVQGGVVGAIVFLAFVLAVGVIAYKSDRRLIDQKIISAIGDKTIQIPGRWDITDRRGIATFTDCLVLQSLELSPNGFFSGLFDTYIYQDAFIQYAGIHRVHACDALTRFYANGGSSTHSAIMSYGRYWFGAASLAKIALGRTGLSLAQYRDVIFYSLILSLCLFTLTFCLSFRPQCLFFAPYLASICFGFSLLSLGQSIGHAPEEIAGLLILSTYNAMHIERRSLRVRTACYSFLGAMCVYLDLLNGVVVLVAGIICCQWIAFTLAEHLDPSLPGKRVLSLVANLSFLGAGGCFAILVRLVGYSYVNGKNVFDALFEWKYNLTYRITGHFGGGTGGLTPPVNLMNMVVSLRNQSGYPFYGILSRGGADFFYAVGFLGWVLSLPLCLVLHEKKKLPSNTLSGFLLAGMLIPSWFFILMEHSIGDAWLTGRLLSLFAGLGMSAFITMFVILKRTTSKTKRSLPDGQDAA
jgi:multisubunit Na+/H+ antiporter MnhB subunit